MKKILCLLVLVSFTSLAQEMDSLAVDSLEKVPPPYYGGVYLIGGVSFEPAAPERNFLGEVGVGIQYERWMLGFSRVDFLGTAQSLLVFPNVFELKYRYGGPYASYSFYQDEKIDLILQAGYFMGDLLWREAGEQQDFIRDEFTLMKIGLAGELSVFRYAKPRLSIGYQQMKDLDLNGVSNDDFTGLYISFGIRLGYFNQ
ncbi:hypothetical protein [Ekhidna sp.]|uniref:hypothetical protein n=1 Tax=Ekhidna sp. TaxID=2608089 RepID=UPI003512393A